MVAIQVPQLDPEIWPEATPERAPAGQPHVRPAPARRALPDRATRVRRRRLAAIALATLLGFAALSVGRILWSAALGSSPAEPIGSAPITGEVYVVQPGDTLWSIAHRIAPGEDPRPIVAELREHNGDAELTPGERLVVRDS
jgi:nucleoid-associated protein YgaU